MATKIWPYAVGVLILLAAQQSFAKDTISCSLIGANANPVGDIEVYSFQWGGSNPDNVGTGGGSGAGKASLGSIVVAKEILQAVAGTALASLNCSFFSEGSTATGAAPSPYLTAVLTNPVLSGLEVTGLGNGDGKQRVRLSFTFESISWKIGS